MICKKCNEKMCFKNPVVKSGVRRRAQVVFDVICGCGENKRVFSLSEIQKMLNEKPPAEQDK